MPHVADEFAMAGRPDNYVLCTGDPNPALKAASGLVELLTPCWWDVTLDQYFTRGGSAPASPQF